MLNIVRGIFLVKGLKSVRLSPPSTHPTGTFPFQSHERKSTVAVHCNTFTCIRHEGLVQCVCSDAEDKLAVCHMQWALFFNSEQNFLSLGHKNYSPTPAANFSRENVGRIYTGRISSRASTPRDWARRKHIVIEHRQRSICETDPMKRS